MRINFSCFGRQIYINAIPYEKPLWLVKLLFPLYWKRMPWKETLPDMEYSTDEPLSYTWISVESLIGQAGYTFVRGQDGQIYTKVYNA